MNENTVRPARTAPRPDYSGPTAPKRAGRDGMAIDPRARLKIIAMEQPERFQTVVAQFNPKEVQVESSIPWQKAPKKHGAADLEYTGGNPESMSFELMFDGFETGVSVVPDIAALKALTRPMEDKGDWARPPKVRVIWGPDAESYNLPTFTSVIESVTVKYQMFSREGQVLRATVNVKLKEAGRLAVGKAR